MRIAILGAGAIGATIGRRLLQSGHDIVYGARDPGAERYRELSSATRVEGIPAAVGSAEAVLLAIPGGAVENLLDAYSASLDGALVLDATNKISGGRLHQIPLLEARLPAARVFRAFNTLGWENFAEPVIGGEVADLFYSGPDGGDRSVVEALIAAVGLRPVYVGAGAEGADVLDGVSRLWFALALGQGRGRHIAFRTLGLPSA